MLSIVMPYWKRKSLLLDSLRTLRELYKKLDFEVVIIDDGSWDTGLEFYNYPGKFQLLKLPEKKLAKNPCVPLNVGVAASFGDIILLTNPEVLHRGPILLEMEANLKRLGPKGYVIASAWNVERKRWCAHSSIPPKANGRGSIPVGSEFHFCSMLYKEFFNEVGGFDESYREGQAYEDNDFLWTLQEHGAKFRLRDDLVVDHFSTPTEWPKGGALRNRMIFQKKWGFV